MIELKKIMLDLKEVHALIISVFHVIPPPVVQKSVVKNLTTSFCKVADQDLEGKISKKPKRKVGEDLDGMHPSNEDRQDSPCV